jgi:ubiquinone/menaquinone biosynthesis C-methylase UbiE
MPLPSVTDIHEHVLSDVSGGRVLDVATGQGGFITVLSKHLKDFTDITGIDVDLQILKHAQGAIHGDGAQVVQMDAARVAFADESFDTVTIALSLHHIPNRAHVLAEMRRVLRPDGCFFVSEMHRDGQTASQLTLIYMHHLAAAVDTARGIPHCPTLARQEIVDLVEATGVRNLAFHDAAIPDAEMDADADAQRLKDMIGTIVQRAEGLPGHKAFQERGAELVRRVDQVGASGEPFLIAIGQK